MAFLVPAANIQRFPGTGSQEMVIGTFENTSGSTGGEVPTGLSHVRYFTAQHTGSAVVANAPVANETFPLNSGDVTLVTDADEDGIWMAIGY